MWLFTTLGFFSCTRSKEDFTKMQVRARTEADLQRLINELNLEARILETPGADYRWRILLSPARFGQVVHELVSRIDYCNFKQAVHEAPGQEDKTGPYLRIWSAMAGVQASAGVPRELHRADDPDLFSPGYFEDLRGHLPDVEALDNPRDPNPAPPKRSKLKQAATGKRRAAK